MARRPALPKDPSQRAKAILDMATGATPKKPKLTPAQEFARKGGLKGGNARAVVLDKETRSSIAKRAAQARWGKSDSGDSDT